MSLKSPSRSPNRPKVRQKPAVSPTRPTILPGFRASPRQRHVIENMSERELNELHLQNERTLASPGASSSSHIERITAEQSKIENQLVEVVGVNSINTGLNRTHIDGDDVMDVDPPPEQPWAKSIDAKRRILENYDASRSSKPISSISFEEAVAIEKAAHVADQERQQKIAEKRKRLGLPVRGEIMSRQEREARIWAFMNAKPSESDLEDDSDMEDSDDEDPSSWFEDNEPNEAPYVDPDPEDLADIIRVDYTHTYNTFNEPND